MFISELEEARNIRSSIQSAAFNVDSTFFEFVRIRFYLAIQETFRDHADLAKIEWRHENDGSFQSIIPPDFQLNESAKNDVSEIFTIFRQDELVMLFGQNSNMCATPTGIEIKFKERTR